jgi:predicted Zn-dependent peptidase
MAWVRKDIAGMQAFSNFKGFGKRVDSKLPELSMRFFLFPRFTESNIEKRTESYLAQRKVPTVIGRLVMNAGYASDAMSKPGLASLAMDMLDEGTKNLNALQISERMQMLGASIGAGSDMDASYVNFTTLLPTFDPTLDLFADILLNPRFRKEFDRQKEHLTVSGKITALWNGFAVFPKFLYGQGRYGNPLYGSVTSHC